MEKELVPNFSFPRKVLKSKIGALNSQGITKIDDATSQFNIILSEITTDQSNIELDFIWN